MPSEWILHVKKVAKEKGIKYGEALKVASKTYKKKTKGKGNIFGKKKTGVIEEKYDDIVAGQAERAREKKKKELEKAKKSGYVAPSELIEGATDEAINKHMRAEKAVTRTKKK